MTQTLATKISLKSNPEQLFMDWFAENFNGVGLESYFADISCYCASFSEQADKVILGGHGQDQSRSVAILKAACELIERRLVNSFYKKNLTHAFRNTNGWAVHFSKVKAFQAAEREALERHILLYTVLSSGWRDFVLLEEKSFGSKRALFLASPYICNDYFAGIVILHDQRFRGVSFGYLADHVSALQSSTRWQHALFEANGFIERSVELKLSKKFRDEAIYNASMEWLTNPWAEISWKRSLELKILPDVKPNVLSGMVSDIIPCTDGLCFSHVNGGGLIPLFFQEDLNSKAKVDLQAILDLYNLSIPSERLPIV